MTDMTGMKSVADLGPALLHADRKGTVAGVLLAWHLGRALGGPKEQLGDAKIA